MENKNEAIKRAFFLIKQIEKKESSFEKVKALGHVNGSDWNRFENYDTILTREDIGEANKLLIKFLSNKIETRVFNYEKELECIAVYKKI
jgi:hypothetical protein